MENIIFQKNNFIISLGLTHIWLNSFFIQSLQGTKTYKTFYSITDKCKPILYRKCFTISLLSCFII